MLEIPFINERKQAAKDQAYGALLGNNLYYSECCEVLEDLLQHFRELDDKCKPKKPTSL